MFQKMIRWTVSQDGTQVSPHFMEEKELGDPFYDVMYQYWPSIELATIEGTALYEAVTTGEVAQGDGGNGPLGDLGITRVVVVPRDEMFFDAFYEVAE